MYLNNQNLLSFSDIFIDAENFVETWKKNTTDSFSKIYLSGILPPQDCSECDEILQVQINQNKTAIMNNINEINKIESGGNQIYEKILEINTEIDNGIFQITGLELENYLRNTKNINFVDGIIVISAPFNATGPSITTIPTISVYLNDELVEFDYLKNFLPETNLELLTYDWNMNFFIEKKNDSSILTFSITATSKSGFDFKHAKTYLAINDTDNFKIDITESLETGKIGKVEFYAINKEKYNFSKNDKIKSNGTKQKRKSKFKFGKK